MKHLFFAIALVMLVYVPYASAIPIEMDDINGFMSKNVGASLTGQAGKITVNEGQTLNGIIENAKILTGKGMKGVKNGDAIKATYMGKNTWKFVHVPTGQQLLQEIKNSPANKKSLVIEPGFNQGVTRQQKQP
jgi:hypothetical protein